MPANRNKRQAEFRHGLPWELFPYRTNGKA